LEQERINLATDMEAKGLIERFRNISSADIGASRTNQLVAAPLGLSNIQSQTGAAPIPNNFGGSSRSNLVTMHSSKPHQ
jgi:hypothetical protein